MTVESVSSTNGGVRQKQLPQHKVPVGIEKDFVAGPAVRLFLTAGESGRIESHVGLPDQKFGNF